MTVVWEILYLGHDFAVNLKLPFKTFIGNFLVISVAETMEEEHSLTM